VDPVFCSVVGGESGSVDYPCFRAFCRFGCASSTLEGGLFGLSAPPSAVCVCFCVAVCSLLLYISLFCAVVCFQEDEDGRWFPWFWLSSLVCMMFGKFLFENLGSGFFRIEDMGSLFCSFVRFVGCFWIQQGCFA
jgi:hypothetical protein